MGIYDRDYYREAAPRWGGGQGSPGTIFLMGMTIGLFFLQALTTRPRRSRRASRRIAARRARPANRR